MNFFFFAVMVHYVCKRSNDLSLLKGQRRYKIALNIQYSAKYSANRFSIKSIKFSQPGGVGGGGGGGGGGKY